MYIKTRVTISLVLLLLFASAQAEEAAGLITGNQMIAETADKVRNIDTAGLKSLIEKQPQTVLIDVRTAGEMARLGGRIDAPRSLNIPRGLLEFQLPGEVPDKDTPIVVYCRINLRSPLAAVTLADMGYTNVQNYADGIFEWKKAGLPMYIPDKYPESMLYDRPREVIPGVWSAIGATQPATYENSGHNNNLSFIITTDGVVVVNAGDNYLLARALHDEIRQITDQPVKYVVLENGQGHAMLGSNYWQEQGAKVIAHVDAAHEISEAGVGQLDRMREGRRDKSLGTKLTTPDITFEDRYVIELGGTRIEAMNLGPAHSPGDIMVWLPGPKLVISGDLAFHQRMLPVFEYTDTAAWIQTWDKFEALEPKYLIPGHGTPTNMDEVRKYTRDYLVYLREELGELIDEGGTLEDAYTIDQSAYAHLHTYDILARQNAGRIFRTMEFE